MIGDQEWHRNKYVQFIVDGFQLTVSVHQEAVIIEMFSILNANIFNIEITPKSLEENMILSFVFETPMEVYQFIVKNQKKLKVSKEGILAADTIIEGKSKNIKIQTEKIVVEDKQLLQKALKMLQEAYKVIDELREKYQMHEDKEIEKKQRVNKKKQEKFEEKSIYSKNAKFQIDQVDQDFKCFVQKQNLLKKISSDRWKTIIGKNKIPQNSVFSFKVKHIKSTTNSIGIFYGVISNKIQRKENNLYSQVGAVALYGSNHQAGYFYPGTIQLCSSGVQSEQIIETIIDTANWTISWKKQAIKLGSQPIPEAMHTQSLFPAIMMYYEGAEIELV